MVNTVYNNRYAFYKQPFLDNNNYLCELYYKNYNYFKKYHNRSVNIYIKPSDLDFAINGVKNRGAAFDEIAIREKKIALENSDLEDLFNDGFFDYRFMNNFDSNSKKNFLDLVKEIIQNNP